MHPWWSYGIQFGQTLQVNSSAGTGQVVPGGSANAISILNQTSTQMVCGASQFQDVTDRATPLCAIPLYGHALDAMAPIDLVMLEFATIPMNTGTVVYQAFSQAILIDLTTQPRIQVSFDINQGWSANGNPYVQFYPPGTNLVPLLVKSG